MSDHADSIDLFEKRLVALERRLDSADRRLDALEHPLSAQEPHSSTALETAPKPPSSTTAPAVQSGSVFPVLGRAMLGIAGAYLLRAVAESNSVPRLAVAWAGIVYAFLWLVWAARIRVKRRFASTFYAGTSTLILAPMLWELTLLFNLFPAIVTAGILCAFALTALALTAYSKSINRSGAPVVHVAFIATAGLALALALASHAFLPFIFVLLTLSAFCEFAPGLDRMLGIRAAVALAADVAIWVLIYTCFSPQTPRGDYPVISRAALLAPGLALFAVFAASVTSRTVFRSKQISAFETMQTTIAFLLAAVGLADFGPSASAMILGFLCLALSLAGYATVFTVFNRALERRNFTVFAAWSTALLLFGCWLCLTAQWAAACLGTAAIASTWVGRYRTWIAFEFYGMLFLLAAALASGLPHFLLACLAGTPTDAPSLGVWFVATCVVLCYVTAKSTAHQSRSTQALRLGVAALASATVAALLVWLLVTLITIQVTPAAHHLAFIRTLTLCAASLALAFGGARLRRPELTRLGYAALALIAIKLVLEDLREGHLEYIAASIFLFAITLIAVPRVARAKNQTLES
jgi:hypothetical protein